MVPEDSESRDEDDGQSPDENIDRTDKLPILGGSVDDDVADDAVRLEYSPVAKTVKSEFRRPSPVLPPTIADGVRSAEERVARPDSQYEALVRSHERMRALLESEQARSLELGKALAGQSAAVERAQARLEETLREAERRLDETRTLHDTIAARDAVIAQLQRSLTEREAQFRALQREHAQIVPSLEERSAAAVQLGADLRAARARLASATADLDGARQTVATLSAQLKRSDEELHATRRDLNDAKAQAGSHLERLRTRVFRRTNESGATPVEHPALLSERDELRRRVADLAAQLSSRDESLARLQSATAAEQTQRTEREHKLQELESRCADLAEKLQAGNLEAQRGREGLSAAEQSRADLALEVLRLRAEAQEREAQMEVLLAHLQEARRLIGQGTPEVKRAAEEQAAKARATEQLAEENRSLRSELDRTRAILEERESALRRLERGESTVIPVGRTAAPDASGVALSPDYAVELVRLDGNREQAHALGRRTRIGRAPGCELHVESSSVSRHHALVLRSSSDVIIEDLQSTNGVLVNGRKVTRQLLTNGDIVTIGEVQFRLRVRPGSREPEAAEPGPPPGPPGPPPGPR